MLKKLNMRKRILIIVGVVFIAVLGIVDGLNLYSKSVTKDISFEITNAGGIVDGTYLGDYEIPPVKAAVSVEVQNGRIANITILEHRTGLGGKAEVIVNDVISNRTLDVDAVSGATTSSMTILKAIEAALQSGGMK
jgi:uncharacterized protein with FMN-binding domain